MSVARHAIAASHVFDGLAVHRDRAVLVDGSRIAALVPRRDVPAGVPVAALPEGLWLAPGFIDTQVNGGGSILFNDTPTPDASRRSCVRTASSAPPRCCRR